MDRIEVILLRLALPALFARSCTWEAYLQLFCYHYKQRLKTVPQTPRENYAGREHPLAVSVQHRLFLMDR